MIPLDSAVQDTLDKIRREATPFMDEMAAAENEAVLGIVRPSEITTQVRDQEYYPFDHPLGRLLVPPGAEPGIPRGCFTLLQLLGRTEPRMILDDLATQLVTTGRPVLVLPAWNYDGPEGARILLTGGGWGGNRWTGLRITMELELGEENGQIIIVEDASIFDNPAAGLWLMHHLRDQGHTIVALGSDLTYLPHVVDYVMKSEERSMSSKDLASQWGASYRDRIWIASMVKSVAAS